MVTHLTYTINNLWSADPIARPLITLEMYIDRKSTRYHEREWQTQREDTYDVMTRLMFKIIPKQIIEIDSERNSCALRVFVAQRTPQYIDVLLQLQSTELLRIIGPSGILTLWFASSNCASGKISTMHVLFWNDVIMLYTLWCNTFRFAWTICSVF